MRTWDFTFAVYVAIYCGALIFVAGCLRRIVQYSRVPLHLRWELYPVPHEEPRRVEHGGSYFEEQGWWRAPQAAHRAGEWRAMFVEIVFLKSLREFNRRLWIPSFLFHFGIYLVIAAAALAALANVLALGTAAAVASVYGFLGLLGAVMILCGALLLLMRRLTDAALKNYTRPGDIFNLLFFLAAFVLLVAGYLLRGADAAPLAAVARGVFHFDCGVRMGTGFGVGMVLASALAAYIPFTHMAHFIAKYFTWHAVRWDDRRSERGGPIERKVAAHLAFKPTWAALHVGADGKRTWAEIATANPTEEVRK